MDPIPLYPLIVSDFRVQESALSAELRAELRDFYDDVVTRWRKLSQDQKDLAWRSSTEVRWRASSNRSEFYEAWKSASDEILAQRPQPDEATLFEINRRVTGAAMLRPASDDAMNPRFAPAAAVSESLKNFWPLLGEPLDLPLIAFAAQRLLEIHPFKDGNGRTVRLFTDLLLARRDFPPPSFESPMDFFLANAHAKAPVYSLEHAIRILGVALSRGATNW